MIDRDDGDDRDGREEWSASSIERGEMPGCTACGYQIRSCEDRVEAMIGQGRGGDRL